MNLKGLRKQFISLVPIWFSVIGSVASIVVLLDFLADRLGISSKLSLSLASGIIAAAAGLFAKQLVEQVRRLQRSPRVFLSYSSTEKTFAHEIYTALRDAGAKVWTGEENLRVGESIVPAIERAMGESDAFLVLLGRESNANVLMELGMARKQGLRIVPVVIGEAEIPSDLAGVFHLKANGESNEVIKKVVDAIT